MKRFLTFLLVLVFTLSLCGCGKTKDASAAEQAIAAIGTVTLDSEDAILNAEKLYGILTDKEKESIKNRIDLVNAREEYDRLVLEAQEEAQQEIFDVAIPVMDEFISDALTSVSDLEFVAKYAGNVNNKGSRKFADSFMERLEGFYKDIDLTVIGEGFPELYESVSLIVSNHEMIIDLLNEMGRTNSSSNVTTMKTLSIETVQMIDSLKVEYQNILNGLN